MTYLEGFPLPATARHDEDGAHIPPHIPAWRRNRGVHTVTGREIEADQRRKAQFAAHLEEHRRRGEPVVILTGFPDPDAEQLSREEAEWALSVVEKHYADHIEPGYGPKLVENWEKTYDSPDPTLPWAIVWYEAGFDWAINASHGDIFDATRVQAEAATIHVLSLGKP